MKTINAGLCKCNPPAFNRMNIRRSSKCERCGCVMQIFEKTTSGKTLKLTVCNEERMCKGCFCEIGRGELYYSMKINNKYDDEWNTWSLCYRCRKGDPTDDDSYLLKKR